MRKKEHKTKAAERVAAKEQKQQKRDAATAQKTHAKLNKGKRTSHKAQQKYLQSVVVYLLLQVLLQQDFCHHLRPANLPHTAAKSTSEAYTNSR
jgi:hypothetical protein